MRITAMFGWGIVIYAVMYLVAGMLAVYGVYPGMIARVAALLALIVVASLAGASLKLHNWKDILPYSLFWALEVIVLDALAAVPLTGWDMYADWNVWVGYSLVVLVPLFAARVHTAHRKPAV